MMKTSRIALWILCLALVASCNKNNGNTGDDVPENGFRAKIEQTKGGGSKGERTHINPEWGNETETGVYWSACDHIKVANHGGNGSTLTFQLTEGENTMYGTFYTGEQNDGFFEPDYMAAYPAANVEGTATTISGSTATFSMLSTQSYKANTFDEGAMPMVASSSTQTLDFYNVFGGLCIPLQGSGMTVTNVKLTSLDPDDKLWGVFTADCASSTPMPTHVSGGSNMLSLDCGAGVALNATTPTDFYFMVPPGTLESGFRVEAFNGTNKIYQKETSTAFGSGFIPRSVVMKVNTSLQVVELPLTVHTINPTYITTNSAFGMGRVQSGTAVSIGLLYVRYDDINAPTDLSAVAAQLVLDSVGSHYLDVFEVSNVTQGSKSYGGYMQNLDDDTEYIVRAYAINEMGIAYYGDPVYFHTLRDFFSGPYPGVMIDQDGVPYEYSVSPTRKVWFSVGNLQFNAAMGSHTRADGTTAPGTWRIAERQYDFVGDATRGNVYQNGVKSDNSMISSTYNGWIDLFGWATSGYHDPDDALNRFYQPYSYEIDRHDEAPYGGYNEYGYGPSSTPTGFNTGISRDLTGEYANYDWGVYNPVSNGGNQPGQWRTLLNHAAPVNINNISTCENVEWGYLTVANNTTNRPYYRFSNVQLRLNGTVDDNVYQITQNFDGYKHYYCYGDVIKGLLITPDGFELPEVGLRYMNTWNSYNNTTYRELSEAEWSLLERLGCVFLPAAGVREEQTVYFEGDANAPVNGWHNHYTSTAAHNSATMRLMRFKQKTVQFSATGYGRTTGCSVRLVRDVE